MEQKGWGRSAEPEAIKEAWGQGRGLGEGLARDRRPNKAAEPPRAWTDDDENAAI